MKAMGLRGTVFHPRYYPGRPAYMSGAYLDILSEIILYAGQLEMEFWIYDENGWPSGSADGHVLEHFPDSRCEWLNYRNGEVVLEGKAGFNTFREMKWHISSSILMMDTGKDCRKRPFPVLPDFSVMRWAFWTDTAYL